jgi:hypothetical protein
MARKSRVPPPPRPVQAPRARLDSTRKDRRALLLIALASVGVLAAVVAAFALGVGGGGNGPEAALREAGCSFKTLPNQGEGHIQSLEQQVKYNSFPPTSGTHFQEPAIFNAYDEPVEQKLGVHNLEHGGVLIQYGGEVAPPAVKSLTGYWRADPTGLLLAPLPQLRKSIALTAWTHLAICPAFDEGAFDAFVDAYRFKGPERLPPEALRPGS